MDEWEGDMDIMIRGLAFAAAALCAGLMGFAIQRGAGGGGEEGQAADHEVHRGLRLQ